MSQTNKAVKDTLTEIIMKLELVNDPDQIDPILDDGVSRLINAVYTEDKLLCEKEVVARFPFMSMGQLRNMRSLETGPKFVKFGDFRNSRIYYKVVDIQEWIDSHYRCFPAPIQ